MLGHSHVVVGCAGILVVEAVAKAHVYPWLDFASQAPSDQLPLMLGAAALGSLLPDLDHPGSALANYRVAGVPLLKPAAYVTSAVFSHRGPTHSLLLWGLLSALVVGIAQGQGLVDVALAASLGYLLHLVADSLTRHGVPWLWPLVGRSFGFPPVKALRISTGGFLEHLAVLGVIGYTVSTLWRYGLPLQ